MHYKITMHYKVVERSIKMNVAEHEITAELHLCFTFIIRPRRGCLVPLLWHADDLLRVRVTKHVLSLNFLPVTESSNASPSQITLLPVGYPLQFSTSHFELKNPSINLTWQLLIASVKLVNAVPEAVPPLVRNFSVHFLLSLYVFGLY